MHMHYQFTVFLGHYISQMVFTIGPENYNHPRRGYTIVATVPHRDPGPARTPTLAVCSASLTAKLIWPCAICKHKPAYGRTTTGTRSTKQRVGRVGMVGARSHPD